MHSNDPTPDDPCGRQLREDDLSSLQAVARRLIEAIAAEPVPDRLRDLAIELNRALERQKATEAKGSSPAPQ